MMAVPVRCFSCGKAISEYYEEYAKRIEKEDPKKVLDDLGITRYCCRRTIFSHKDLTDQIMKYNL